MQRQAFERFLKAPVSLIKDDMTGPQIRKALFEIIERLMATLNVSEITSGSGSGSGSGSSGSGWLINSFHANGPYQVDTNVDGGFVSSVTETIGAVILYREVAGTSGSTILDLNKNGTSMYTTTANRPTIAFNDSDLIVIAALPDIVSIAPFTDVITVDTDQIEGGEPENWSLFVGRA